MNTVLASDQDIAVNIEASSPAERMTLFGRASGLSTRDLELFGHLVEGSGDDGLTSQARG